METKFVELDLRRDTLRERRQRAAQSVVADFDDMIDVSWIYHDHALEGVVLSYHELKAAIDKRIISDVTLIPMYEEIKCYKRAIEWIRETARQPLKRRKGSITLETLRTIHSILTPDEEPKGNPYRKDNPLHRLYFHEISAPDKIAPRMKKLIEWLDSDETQQLHPIERAARAHYHLMAIYPWSKNSGKVARLLMNLLLLRDGYAPAVVHAIERQRYYDVLRHENAGLVTLVAESLSNGIETAIRFFEELKAARRQARKAS